MSFFDILGFKEFIMNNDEAYVKRFLEATTLSSQQAITDMKIRKDRPQPDFDNAEVSCLHVSDTIVFWTKDVSEKSFRELVKVTYNFNWLQNLYNLPVRGCMVFGNIEYNPFSFATLKNAKYGHHSLYGKALITGYTSAESQVWAGSHIHESVITQVGSGIIEELKKEGVVMEYNIPFKDGEKVGLAFRYGKTQYNPEAFQNTAKDFDRVFRYCNNDYDQDERVVKKLQNTIKFLEAHKE
jgi:hypothetical protein